MQEILIQGHVSSSSHRQFSSALQYRRQEEREKKTKNNVETYSHLAILEKVSTSSTGQEATVVFHLEMGFISPSSLVGRAALGLCVCSCWFGWSSRDNQEITLVLCQDAVCSLKGKNETIIEGQSELTQDTQADKYNQASLCIFT